MKKKIFIIIRNREIYCSFSKIQYHFCLKKKYIKAKVKNCTQALYKAVYLTLFGHLARLSQSVVNITETNTNLISFCTLKRYPKSEIYIRNLNRSQNYLKKNQVQNGF